LAFVLSGVDFEDDRIPRGEWPTRKAKTPFGRVPLLTLEGKPPLPECNAILRYIAREYGLEPKDAWERARCDALMEACEDLRSKIWHALKVGTTEEERKAARQELASGVLSDWARAVEAQIIGPFVFGDSPTVADIKLFMIRSWVTSGVIDYMPKDVLADYPKLARVSENLAALPEIAAFRAKHS
jgi:glutathione S-transferase